MQRQTNILTPEAMAQAVGVAVAEGGRFLLTVTGGSMVPALLHERSQVELVAPEDIARGDILLARRGNGTLVLHRAVALEGDVITLNGDAQRWMERVDRSQVLAKVSRIFRQGKWYACGSAGDRLYCRLWGLTRPVRPAMFRMYAKIKRKSYEPDPKTPSEN